ncbi:MAG: DUF3683 domain-containing protein [Mariprofundaceae bacterium]
MSSEQIREIPYNYTSYSDREIVLRFLGRQAWDDLSTLRGQRRTGRSARMLFEILGDVWVVSRNPFIRNDLLEDKKRLKQFRALHEDRLSRIESGAVDNPLASKVTGQARAMLDEFYRWFDEEKPRRKKALKAFARVTHANNVHFDAFAKMGHATDATDWRQEYPFAVITPDDEHEIAGIVRVAAELDLIIIPRGGGTGLCGASVPLHENSVMINTEKLDDIDVVEKITIGGRATPTIRAQCGAVTGCVMEAARPYVFATDPTSLWACTIGGNVATNAGGKHAVIWGTCVDNLLAWNMVTPDGKWLMVERLDHNLGRIPPDEDVRFRLSRFDADGKTPLGEAEIISIHGSVFRREGLGKDVTRKALGGLPGVQKEGTDGFVTSATFVLHRPFAHTRTVCCEFFDFDLSDATRAMVEIKAHVDGLADVHIEGLEHFDEKYVKAIDYSSKSTRRERPRVVLLIDVSGDDGEKVGRACAGICRIASGSNGEGFVATSVEDRGRFWSDRGRMAAIAKHTRAFKLNEDVVIPLSRLAEYSDYVERLNIENSMANKLCCVRELAADLKNVRERLSGADSKRPRDSRIEDDGFLADKLDRAGALLAEVEKRWQRLLDSLDQPAEKLARLLGETRFEPDETLLRLIQHGRLRISYRREVEAPLLDMLRGHAALQQTVLDIHARVLSSRIVIATHMHAGDGNVHTNIPVNSNDYDMMRAAHHVVEKIMAKAVELGGVISGEHGIGITKLAYMPPEYLEEMAAYNAKADPHARFNRDKLMPGTNLSFAYTPSFNLLQMEAMILEAADLTELSEEIADCLRCGKCKPACNTHFPSANMLYAPRNKILATAGIIEAFLYEAQTGDGISYAQFAGLQDVADHCTICHKCESPCPVNIDFGKVTEHMRALLKDKGQARFSLGSRLSLLFLTLQHPDAVKLMREVVIRWGYAGQRMVSALARRFGVARKKPAAKRNLAGVQAKVISFVERPLPGVPGKTARTILGIDDKRKNLVPILRHPKKAQNRAVFYFPGCGSERLYSQVALASQSMLYELGLNVVLPPGYLCCGYPSTASGDVKRGDKISYDNRVLFHRLKNALSYLDFEAVVVSCGTCFDQLTRYELEQVFPEAPLIDIHEYLMEQGVHVDDLHGQPYVYHEPCHTPLKRHGSAGVIDGLLGARAEASGPCCGEAGTLAITRPDIAGKVRARKEEEIALAKQRMAANDRPAPTKILTSCPSCLQGLSRLEGETELQADYIVIELARRLHGEDWQAAFVQRVSNGGIERVLM